MVTIKEKRGAEIVALADSIRSANNFVHRNVDVVELANKYGFKVYQLKESAPVKGLILGDDSDNFGVIAFKQDLSNKDNRFIIAHELGHFLLHHDDEKFKKNGVFYYAYHSDENHSEQEREADLFAANLLMPKEAFINKWKEIGGQNDNLSKEILSEYFGVTTKSIEKRIKEINV